jgi:hypothetical protein
MNDQGQNPRILDQVRQVMRLHREWGRRRIGEALGLGGDRRRGAGMVGGWWCEREGSGLPALGKGGDRGMVWWCSIGIP